MPAIMSLLYLYPANLLSASNLFYFLANLSPEQLVSALTLLNETPAFVIKPLNSLSSCSEETFEAKCHFP